MREFFIAFRSRAEAVRYYEMLRTYNISCRLINTPSSLRVGCGLSVKLFAKDMSMAKIVLDRGHYPSCIGLYYFSQGSNAIKL